MSIVSRAVGKYRRTMAKSFGRRDLRIDSGVPLISFTFDDAPCSAFDIGREILESRNARATYFVSLGLLDTVTSSGRIADSARLRAAFADGHELGCHTFDHLDAWHVDVGEYISSVDRNRAALSEHVPGAEFRSFAYPKSGATLASKSALADRFECCRGGGQTFNHKMADRGLLSSCFLDIATGISIQFVRNLVDGNKKKNGWLIFSNHEVAASGSLFRCTPKFFEDVVDMSVASGAEIVPVSEAYDHLLGTYAAI